MSDREFIDSLNDEQLDAFLDLIEGMKDEADAERTRADRYQTQIRTMTLILSAASAVIAAAAAVINALTL